MQRVLQCEQVAGSSVEPISFIVPRKGDSFQSDIFPPAPSSQPAMSAGDFFGGKTASPTLLDMDSRQTTDSPSKPYTPMTATSHVASQASTPASPASKQPTPQTSAPPKEREVAPKSSVSSLKAKAEADKPLISKEPFSTSPQASLSSAPSKAASTEANRSPVEASSSKANSQDDSTMSGTFNPNGDELSALRKRISELEGQLDERDGIIRTLELKVEKMAGVVKQAQDAFAAVSI